MRLCVALILVLTLALGLCVAASLYIVGGRVALLGPGVVERSWPLIYLLQALFAAGLLFGVARAGRDRLHLGRVAVVVVGAWLGQYLVLASGILADELNPVNATYYWILATGGPLQPIAALVGGALGLRGGVTALSR